MKPTIFISHIGEESVLAQIFKDQIEASFLGMADIFVSSDARSIEIGMNWLDQITTGLRKCEAMLVFCSPQSVPRPWINFECGAGWARDIQIAPLCHSGMRPIDLPLPISLLQGIQLSDPSQIRQIFQMISGKLRCREPEVDHQKLAERVKDFETKYEEETKLLARLRDIRAISSELFDILCKVPVSVLCPVENVPERIVERVRPHLEALERDGHFSFGYGVMGFEFGGASGGGNFGTLNLKISPRLKVAAESLAKTSY